MKSDFHKSVFLKEALDLLQIESGKKYIDATLGGGGHTKEILKRGGDVLGIDADKDAIDYVRNRIKSYPFGKLRTKLKFTQGNFRNIDKIAKENGIRKVSGILYDLGVSSFQIESETRGFTFQKDAELDMRMDQEATLAKAADILNLASEDQLYEIFTKFGEEHRPTAISRAIVRAREVAAIKTTGDLLKIIQEVYGLKGEISVKTRATIAKRIFQALRIAVNDELESLKQSLPKALLLLEPKGRLVVISFHSLEDRIVKDTFLSFEKENLGRVITKKPLTPALDEISDNPRARSAKLRVFEKYENL